MSAGYLLDTDHISFIQKEDCPEYSLVMAKFEENKDTAFFCVVSFHEQSQGVLNKLNPSRKLSDLLRGYRMQKKLLDSYQKAKVLAFDDTAGTVWEMLDDLNLRIGRMDLRIGAIARANNLTLVTRNKSDFSKIPNLRIEDWSK